MIHMVRGLTLLLSILLLGLLPAWSAVPDTPSIELIDDSWDFGFIPSDYTVVHYYRIKNIGGSDLHIDQLTADCDCTSAYAARKVLPPDSTTEIKLIFETKGYYGANTRQVTIHSNDPEKPTVTIDYTSNIGVIPSQLRVGPKSLFFLPGHKPKELVLENLTDDDVEYSLTLESDSVVTISESSGKLKSGKSVSLLVAPKANLPRGTHYSSLAVTFISEIEVRQTVPLRIVRY
ncbi:MAG: DUF1573 domain-containing protein [Candidatus Zixiibacteriota bacterium]|nr:MAG: DUF1573 domain-containing protein [candidate division Zixibacteria bacterium]